MLNEAKLWVKITAGFFVMLALAAGIGFFSYFEFEIVKKQADAIDKAYIPELAALADLRYNTTEVLGRLALRAANGNYDPERLKSHQAQLQSAFGKLKDLVRDHGATLRVLSERLPEVESLIRGLGLSVNGAADAPSLASLEAQALVVKTILIKAAQEGALQKGQVIMSEIRYAETSILFGIACALVLGVILSLLIVRAVAGPLEKVIRSLNEGAEQLAVAATETANSAQNVAGVTTEMSASLQETSASIEEITSMVQKNADHALEANGVMQDTDKDVTLANDAMKEMQQSMGSIQSNSQQMAKIIRAIEEIAFQTNLLALNAAVEAARAGEHGQGFAVVADEVRNLAQRAASSAKDISALIETAGNDVRLGLDRAERVAQRLIEVTQGSKRVAALVQEIATASTEQASGIQQINKAVAEMEKGTQEVAASAEESAASSEEISSQVESMRDVVTDLRRVVDGGQAVDTSRQRRSRSTPRTVAARPVSAGNKASGMKSSGRATVSAPARTALLSKNPEDVLPLREDEF